MLRFTFAIVVVISVFTVGHYCTMLAIATNSGVYASSVASISRGGIKLFHGFKWLRVLNKRVFVGMEGDPGDCDEIFRELSSLQRSEDFVSDSDESLTCSHVAECCQRIIHRHLRSPHRLQANVFVCGQENAKPSLHWIDELGIKQRVRYAAVGPGSNLLYSLLDQQNTLSPLAGRDNSDMLAVIAAAWNVVKGRSSLREEPEEGLMLLASENGPGRIDKM